MKKNTSSLFFALIVIAGLIAMPASAYLGLQQIAAAQGASAVGHAVLAAARAVYAANTDPAIIQNQLISILNEAAATGNETAVRYAIIAVMMAGGSENLATSKAAIDNSNVFTNYETLTAVTVAEMEALLAASGQTGETAGGGGSGGGGGGGQGVIDGPKGPIDPDNPFPPATGTDGDLPATRI